MGKVLILEDDKAFALALSSLLTQEGLDVVTAVRPSDALEILQASDPISYFLVDCLLPDENGVDFVVRNEPLLKQKKIEVILMSGILTDTNFVRDSVRRTRALEFLKKPFATTELLRLMKVTKKKEEIPPRQGLYQLMSKEIITTREQRKAIEALDTVHGFDLPYIYSLLIRTELSGHLNVVRSTGQIFSVTFANGRIAGVDTDDEATLIGKMLIESGFVLPDDLETVLEGPQGQRKIGDKLISANLLSPHGLERVLSAQMSLRLTRTIVDENIKLNLSVTDLPESKIAIDLETFEKFLHDSIASKITLVWLKTHFTRSINDEVVPGPRYLPNHPVFQTPLVQNVPDLVAAITEKKAVSELLQSDKTDDEEARTKALFLLLLEGVVSFRKLETRSNQNLAMLLQKVWQQFNGKSDLEIQDVVARMTGGIDSASDQVHRDFIKLIGRPEEAKAAGQTELYNKIVGKLESSLKERPKAETAGEEMTNNMIKVEGFRKFEKGYEQLQQGNYRSALDLLKQAEIQDPKIARLSLYLCWAKVGLADKGMTKEIDLQLTMIPPEDKYDAVYSYVLGLHSRNKNEMRQAQKYFEKALALDNHFIFARREIAKLQTGTPEKTNIFNGDLTAVVANLFQKKKSG